MKRILFSGAVWLALLLALLGGRGAMADTIASPSDYFNGGAYIGWYYGCFYEYGPNACGLEGPFGNTVGGLLSPTTGNVGYLTGSMGAPTDAFSPVNGEGFSYSEVDDANGNPLDYFAFSNSYQTEPVTFTFADSSDTVPQNIDEFATMIYDFNNPFTVVVSAYDAQGDLLGSTSTQSVYNADENCAGVQGCYSAFAGVDDINAESNNIASVVISTNDNWFGFGTVEVGTVPEPATLGLMFAAAGVLWLRRRMA